MTRRVGRATLATACILVGACRAAFAPSSVVTRWVEPGTGLTFILVAPGQFLMGSPAEEAGREAQETQHAVTLTRSFWLGEFEITQGQWKLVTGDNPSWFAQDGEMRPVENVTWFQVQEFLRRLTMRAAGNMFRLPTEAEWEYACRSGTTTAYGVGSVLNAADANIAPSPEHANKGQTARIGSFPPNPWGFRDMHGNVWEWTADEHCPYEEGPAADPRPGCSSPLKVIRGGSWYFGADSARCALRYTHRAQDRGFSLGFRVVRESL